MDTNAAIFYQGYVLNKATLSLREFTAITFDLFVSILQAYSTTESRVLTTNHLTINKLNFFSAALLIAYVMETYGIAYRYTSNHILNLAVSVATCISFQNSA